MKHRPLVAMGNKDAETSLRLRRRSFYCQEPFIAALSLYAEFPPDRNQTEASQNPTEEGRPLAGSAAVLLSTRPITQSASRSYVPVRPCSQSQPHSQLSLSGLSPPSRRPLPLSRVGGPGCGCASPQGLLWAQTLTASANITP